MTTRLVIADADGMEALGARLAALLAAGDLVMLNGPLGAGKTTLTRGLGEALGARGAVTSPTFVLAREPPTPSGGPRNPVDAYRLATARELDDLDLDYDGAIVVVEWGAGKLDGVADTWIDVTIAREAIDDSRDVTITGHGPRWAALDDVLGRLDSSPPSLGAAQPEGSA